MSQLRLSVVLMLLVAVFRVAVTTWDYPAYHNYDDAQKQIMFINGGAIDANEIPFMVAVLNSTYCTVANQLLSAMNPMYKRLTAMKNITLVPVCNYTAPQTITEASIFYSIAKNVNSELNNVDAFLGDYNPLVSTIAESLRIPFLIVNAENPEVSRRIQKVMGMTEAIAGPTNTFADLNDYTFLVESDWYHSVLYSSILAPSPYLGNQVFGSNYNKFLRLGVIYDGSVLLPSFLLVNRGPLITSLVAYQIDRLYNYAEIGRGNITSTSMDVWTSSFQSCSALVISLKTDYTMSLLPLIMDSLLHIGFFTSETVTVIGSSLVSPVTFVNYSDTQSTIYVLADVFYLNIYNQTFPTSNITLSPPSWMSPSAVLAPIVSDPVVRGISIGFYYLTMQLLQLVYQSQYIDIVISSLNWPPIIQKDIFLRSALTYGVLEQQYNNCQFLYYALNVKSPTACSISNISQTQSMFNTIGYWQGIVNLLIDETYTTVSSVVSDITTSTPTTTASTAREAISGSSLSVGFVVDPPFVIPCEECPLGHQGYAVEILGNLSVILHFNYTLKQYESYTAMMADLNSLKIDMAVGAILSGNSTQQFGYNVSLVSPILDTGLNLLIRNDTTTLWFSWLQPYSPVMWVTLVVCLVLLTMAFMLLDIIDPNEVGKQLFNFFASYWYVFGSFTQSSVEIMPVTFGAKVLSMLMWFTVIIVVATYTAAYTSFLLINDTPPFINNVNEGLSSFYPMPNSWNNAPFYFTNGSIAATYLSTSYNPLYLQAINHPKTHVVSNIFDAAARLLEAGDTSKVAYFGDARVNQWMSNLLDCWVVTVGDIDAVVPVFYSVVALPPNSSYLSIVNTALLNLERLKVLPIMKRYYFDSQCTSAFPPAPLDISDLAGLYMGLAIGIMLSLFSVAVELIMKKMQLSTQRLKSVNSTRFTFGNVYFARVIRTVDSGVAIKIYDHKKDELKEAAGKKLDPPPLIYSMFMEDLNMGNAKMKTPVQMGLLPETGIYVKYLGVSPKTGYERFIFLEKENSSAEV